MYLQMQRNIFEMIFFITQCHRLCVKKGLSAAALGNLPGLLFAPYFSTFMQIIILLSKRLSSVYSDERQRWACLLATDHVFCAQVKELRGSFLTCTIGRIGGSNQSRLIQRDLA